MVTMRTARGILLGLAIALPRWTAQDKPEQAPATQQNYKNRQPHEQRVELRTVDTRKTATGLLEVLGVSLDYRLLDGVVGVTLYLELLLPLNVLNRTYKGGVVVVDVPTVILAIVDVVVVGHRRRQVAIAIEHDRRWRWRWRDIPATVVDVQVPTTDAGCSGKSRHTDATGKCPLTSTTIATPTRRQYHRLTHASMELQHHSGVEILQEVRLITIVDVDNRVVDRDTLGHIDDRNIAVTILLDMNVRVTRRLCSVVVVTGLVIRQIRLAVRLIANRLWLDRLVRLVPGLLPVRIAWALRLRRLLRG